MTSFIDSLQRSFDGDDRDRFGTSPNGNPFRVIQQQLRDYQEGRVPRFKVEVEEQEDQDQEERQ